MLTANSLRDRYHEGTVKALREQHLRKADWIYFNQVKALREQHLRKADWIYFDQRSWSAIYCDNEDDAGPSRTIGQQKNMRLRLAR